MTSPRGHNLLRDRTVIAAAPPTVAEYRARPAAPDRIEGGSRPRNYVVDLPVFTILMPVRNGEATIEQAIQSVIAQDYPNIEFLVADGKSTDGTLDILRKYDAHITYWLSEKDKNTTDATNKIAVRATGAYVMMLLCDDWLPQDYFRCAKAAFDRTKADFVFGDLKLYDGDRQLYRFRGNPNYQKTIRYELSFTTPSWAFKREMLEHIGLFKLVDVAPDYEWFLRVHLAEYKGAYDAKIAYCFRFGGNSTVNAFLGYQEVRRIAIAYGAHPAVAWFHYLRTITRHRTRLLLEKILPNFLIMTLRRTRRKVIDSINRWRHRKMASGSTCRYPPDRIGGRDRDA